MNEFSGKNILITGASSGIGKTTALHLSSLGATVILIGRNQARLQQVKEQIQGSAFVVPCDLENLQQIKNIFLFCKENNLKLDGLVHSAGVCSISPIRCNQIEETQRSMNINALSFLEMGKYISLKKYSNSGCSVVAVSSVASTLCSLGQSSYAASKAALEIFVRVMAREVAEKKMRINAICPAMTNTPMYESTAEEYPLERINEMQPLGLIEPLYLAYLIEFLLSEKARYITGVCIPVNAAWRGDKKKGKYYE